MFQEFKNLFHTDTGKDTSIVFIGTAINILFGGIFFILAARFLGPENYGLFSTVVATGLLFANIANFGIDTGILRFAKENDDALRQRILKLAFQTYIAVGAAIFLLGFLFSSYLASYLGHPDLSTLFKIASASIIFLLLTNFFIATLQTKKEFIKASFVNISSNLARLSILVIGAYFATIDLYFVTILFFTVTIVSAVAGKIFVPLDFLKEKHHRLEIKKFFGYNFWIAASIAITSIPIDQYFLLKFASSYQAGIYAAPLKLLSVTDQFAGNFSRVLASRFTSFDTHQKAINFSQKTLPIVAFVCLGILSLTLLAPVVVNSLLGIEYSESIQIFQIIAISYVFFFANTIAMSLIIYYFGDVKFVFNVTLFRIVTWAALNYFLIPKYQATGAAIALLITSIISFVLPTAYSLWKLKLRNSQ